MITKFIFLLAVTSLAALALDYLGGADDEAILKREVAGQMDALREHLFRR